MRREIRADDDHSPIGRSHGKPAVKHGSPMARVRSIDLPRGRNPMDDC
jgi:hypothetical protein